MSIIKLTVRGLLFCMLFFNGMSHAETINLSVPGPGSLVYLPVQLSVPKCWRAGMTMSTGGFLLRPLFPWLKAWA